MDLARLPALNAAMVDRPFFNAPDETSQTDGTFAIKLSQTDHSLMQLMKPRKPMALFAIVVANRPILIATKR